MKIITKKFGGTVAFILISGLVFTQAAIAQVDSSDVGPVLIKSSIGPPAYPNDAFLSGNYSGYCTVKFDVSMNGIPFNIDPVTCTNDSLSEPSLDTVSDWRFTPKLEDG